MKIKILYLVIISTLFFAQAYGFFLPCQSCDCVVTTTCKPICPPPGAPAMALAALLDLIKTFFQQAVNYSDQACAVVAQVEVAQKALLGLGLSCGCTQQNLEITQQINDLCCCLKQTCPVLSRIFPSMGSTMCQAINCYLQDIVCSLEQAIWQLECSSGLMLSSCDQVELTFTQ